MTRTPHEPLHRPRSGAAWRDPWSSYRALRDEDPVHHVVDGDYWVLSRFDDVFAAARDTTTFSSAQGLTHLYDDVAAAGLGAALGAAALASAVPCCPARGTPQTSLIPWEG